MQITRLRIKNYRAIQLIDVNVPAKGAIAKGGNARGKTTVLRAVRAALLARDIGPDSIREGSDKAEILVDMDDPHCLVRRTITENGSTLSVETSPLDVKKKPQTYLAELLGTSPLDPLDLFLAKRDERRKLVLAALPVKIEAEDIARWVPEWARDTVPSHILDVLSGMHGVDACATMHKIFYEARAEANAAAKDATNRVAHLEKEHTEKFASVVASNVTAAEAATQLDAARAEYMTLDTRKKRAVEQSQKFAAAREQIADLRKRAAIARDAGGACPSEDEVKGAAENVREAIAKLRAAEERLAAFNTQRERARRFQQEATALDESAATLERTLASATEKAPSDEEIEAAKEKGLAAREAHERAVMHGRATASLDEVTKATEEASQRAARAKDLTEIVDRLRVDAPRELLERSQGIPGLGIAGDDLTLDGKSIDAVSGREQMAFAVEVARRANAKAKILVVDGLERLDADALPAFIAAATRDGFQLLATRVDRGEMVIEPLQLNEKDEAAE